MVEKHLSDWHLGPYSVYFIFFVANEWTLLVRVFHYTWLEGLSSVKHSSLLGLFVGYKQNEAVPVFYCRDSISATVDSKPIFEIL